MARFDEALTALNDPELRTYLTATEEHARNAALDRVIRDVARPVISRVLQQCRRRIAAAGARDTDDIEAAVLLRVVQKLESARTAEDDAVSRLDEYVARLTFNAVADVRRESAPEWARLKRRLRYTAMADPRLAAWDVPAGTLCGLEVTVAPGRQPGEGGRAGAGEVVVLSRPILGPPGVPGDACHVTAIQRQCGPVELDDARQARQLVLVGDGRRSGRG